MYLWFDVRVYGHVDDYLSNQSKDIDAYETCDVQRSGLEFDMRGAHV